MRLFERMASQGHEQVVYWAEPENGYRGIIAVHDTSLGPSLGGTRFWSYASEEEALTDALRLSRAMTYKAAVAGLDLGGGKSVILGDNRTLAREPIFRAHGRAIQALGGHYYAAEDVGTSEEDMAIVRKETAFVTGLRSGAGDPSPLTALGTFEGIRACAQVVYGDPSLQGKHVAVQGLGHVGERLCAHLAKAGARLTVTDVDEGRIRRAVDAYAAVAVGSDDIYGVPADIFSPCALGSVLNDETIRVLKVRIVAGAANNQLAEERHAEELQRRDILYAPDYVINAGGVINVYRDLKGFEAEWSRKKAIGIHETLLNIFRLASENGVTPAAAADRIAEDRLEEARRRRRPVPSSGALPHLP